MQVIDAARLRAALPFDRLVPALRAMFAGGGLAAPRQMVEVAAADGTPAFTSLLMAAWQPGRCYGVKVINVAPGNGARGLPGLHASYLLHDACTGVPLALLNGDELTARRTAAASALAAATLAREDASRLLVLGGGRVARQLPDAHRAVRPIAEVEVWTRRPAQAEALAAQWRAGGLPARAVTDLAEAVARADIVSCATAAAAPLVEGRWLRPGSHLDLIGGFTPTMREADDDCFAGATLAMDTEDAWAKSGDLLGPRERGVIGPEPPATLAALVRGDACGRRRPDERTVFKSVGHALEDLAAAMLAWQSLAPGAAPGIVD